MLSPARLLEMKREMRRRCAVALLTTPGIPPEKRLRAMECVARELPLPEDFDHHNGPDINN